MFLCVVSARDCNIWGNSCAGSQRDMCLSVRQQSDKHGLGNRLLTQGSWSRLLHRNILSMLRMLLHHNLRIRTGAAEGIQGASCCKRRGGSHPIVLTLKKYEIKLYGSSLDSNDEGNCGHAVCRKENTVTVE